MRDRPGRSLTRGRIAAARPHLAAIVAVLCTAGLTLLSAGQEPATPDTPATSPPPPAAGQQPPGQPPPRFRIEANYVRVDAYPTRNGQPVLDLQAADFELLENGAPQKIEAFEHVVVSPAGPQSLRVEGGSVRGGEQMAANPRNRVFVFFLDVPHVAVEGSHAIKEPMIRLIDRILGPDDLVAVMTPFMAASQVTFGRKTDVIADMMRQNWTWGMRHRLTPMDEREIEYERCYPAQSQQELVAQLVARRRERIVLDALRDLVNYLGSIREERKAIIPITTGWVLYRPNQDLLRPRVVSPMTGQTEPLPGSEPVGVDQHGKLRLGGARSREGEAISQTECDRERMHLANIDNDEYFREIIDFANRNNASFYPVDPRGLAAFDYPIDANVPIALDRISLSTRLDTIRTLAEATDGMAVVNTNNLDAGLKRIADDLTSYYLLGYYSSNTKLDGTFRKITVRVKRPGVDVRARRGYRAATAEEVSASTLAAAAPVPEHVRAAGAALASLTRIGADRRFALNATPVRDAAGSISALWIAGELRLPLGEFAQGGTVVIEALEGAAASSVTLKPGERSFLVKVPVTAKGQEIDIRARATPQGGAEPLADSLTFDPSTVQPLLFRRGPSTGNRVQPAADFRFSRTERLRLEVPLAAGSAAKAGRLLDRNGEPLPIPIQIADRTDSEGQRWLTADATLASLAPGDYVVEITYDGGASEQRVLTAVRVTR